jgi:hypothetical protein
MTTATLGAAPPKRRLHGLLPPKPEVIKVNGKLIKGRALQTVLWIGLAGVSGAALVAGWYFNLLQVNWHIHAGSFYYSWDHLKLWWDNGMGFIHSPSWVLYRHPYRDMGEPAVAVLFIKTLLAPRKYWNVRVGTPRLLLTPLACLVAAAILITGAVWLLDFGLPHLWPNAPVPAKGWETFIFGIAIGQILHHLWGPCGATIQGALLDRSVDKNGTYIPKWVRYPLMAPLVRERWSWMQEHNATRTIRKPLAKWIMVLIWISIVLGAYFIVTGFIGHFWVGVLGHSFPYLAP